MSLGFETGGPNHFNNSCGHNKAWRVRRSFKHYMRWEMPQWFWICKIIKYAVVRHLDLVRFAMPYIMQAWCITQKRTNKHRSTRSCSSKLSISSVVPKKSVWCECAIADQVLYRADVAGRNSSSRSGRCRDALSWFVVREARILCRPRPRSNKRHRIPFLQARKMLYRVFEQQQQVSGVWPTRANC